MSWNTDRSIGRNDRDGIYRTQDPCPPYSRHSAQCQFRVKKNRSKSQHSSVMAAFGEQTSDRFWSQRPWSCLGFIEIRPTLNSTPGDESNGLEVTEEFRVRHASEIWPHRRNGTNLRDTTRAHLMSSLWGVSRLNDTFVGCRCSTRSQVTETGDGCWANSGQTERIRAV